MNLLQPSSGICELISEWSLNNLHNQAELCLLYRFRGNTYTQFSLISGGNWSSSVVSDICVNAESVKILYFFYPMDVCL